MTSQLGLLWVAHGQEALWFRSGFWEQVVPELEPWRMSKALPGQKHGAGFQEHHGKGEGEHEQGWHGEHTWFRVFGRERA